MAGPGPRMRGVFDAQHQRDQNKKISYVTIETIILILIECALFYYGLHYLSTHSRQMPMLNNLFPVIGILFLASVAPLIMFLAYQDDFANLRPIIPSNYLFLIKRVYDALQQGNGKVSAKDL